MNQTKKDLKKALAKVERFSIKTLIHKRIEREIAIHGSKAEAFRVIEQATGIGKPWLQKFTVENAANDPGLSKIETLYFYFYGVSIHDIIVKG